MQKGYLLFFCTLLSISITAQTIKDKLAKATSQLENDAQMKHAIYGLLVIDATTGKVIFDKNSQVGLVPASCQKIITSATAFELLGKDFQYKTDFAFNNTNAQTDSLKLYIIPHGDPTFGSWRYTSTNEDSIFKKLTAAIKKTNYSNRIASCYIVEQGFSKRFFPSGWIWQDLGNYYGAGQGALNWRENQFDIIANTGNEDSKPQITKLIPAYANMNCNTDELQTGPKGSGDKTFTYLDPTDNNQLLITGTMPAAEKKFSISVSHPNPVLFFSNYLQSYALKFFPDNITGMFKRIYKQDSFPSNTTIFYTHYSPTLDSIVYWFLKKSLNLYGEALLKTMAREKQKLGSTENGVDIVQNFWLQKGIDRPALNIGDGSGLSPQNHVTTTALATVLQYAQKQPWFAYYYNAFPEYNGMKLKSGTIAGVKGFCGYHTARNGNKYIIAFLINNYNGSSSSITGKMYEVLNVLK